MAKNSYQSSQSHSFSLRFNQCLIDFRPIFTKTHRCWMQLNSYFFSFLIHKLKIELRNSKLLWSLIIILKLWKLENFKKNSLRVSFGSLQNIDIKESNRKWTRTNAQNDFGLRVGTNSYQPISAFHKITFSLIMYVLIVVRGLTVSTESQIRSM